MGGLPCEPSKAGKNCHWLEFAIPTDGKFFLVTIFHCFVELTSAAPRVRALARRAFLWLGHWQPCEFITGLLMTIRIRSFLEPCKGLDTLAATACLAVETPWGVYHVSPAQLGNIVIS